MQKIVTILLLSCISLFTLACSKKEEKKDDFFVFDFGTEYRMVSQGFLKKKAEDIATNQDLGGYIISNADDRLEMKIEYSGGSYSLSELISEEISSIKLKGRTEKEIFVASSYYDHSAKKQIILFVESIGSGEIDYTVSIEDILDLRKEGHNQSQWAMSLTRHRSYSTFTEEMNITTTQRTLIWPLCVVISAALIALSIWQISEKNRFTITAGFSESNIPYLCDTKTGKVWRYYRNYDSDKKKYTSEGFMILHNPWEKTERGGIGQLYDNNMKYIITLIVISIFTGCAHTEKTNSQYEYKGRKGNDMTQDYDQGGRYYYPGGLEFNDIISMFGGSTRSMRREDGKWCEPVTVINEVRLSSLIITFYVG
jgi:hypothetical protein